MIKGYYVSNDGVYYIWDRWVVRYFDNGFVGDDFVDRCCLCRIGSCGLYVVLGCVGFLGDNCVGFGSGMFEFFNKWSIVVDIEYFLFV